MPPTQGTNAACIRVLAIDDHPVFLGERAARTHVVNIQEKLGAANNAQAIARAFKLGHLRPLVPPPG